MKFLSSIKKYWKLLITGCFFLCVLFSLFFLRIYKIDGKTSIEIGNPKDSLIIVKANEIVKRNIPFLKKADFAEQYEKIGWVTDIHADRFKHRDVPSGMMFPRQYSDYLPKVFDDMRSHGIDTVIATGDNTNSGDNNYARAIKHIADEKHMNVIWVKGNHDNNRVMSTLGVTGNKYYYVDYGNARIIVLDDVENNGDYLGSIDQIQLDWLKETLKTEKQVIVAMHIPIFDEVNTDKMHDIHGGNFPNMGNLSDVYTQLESIFHQSGNVKMVISGHWHLPWQKEYDGISYYGEAALTRESYFGAYAEIDLKNDSVNYLFAK